MDTRDPIELTSWAQVREALRNKNLRQAGYREGAVVMEGTLLDLHGAEHRERRRVENRLFRRATFAHWEHEVLGSTIEATLQPFVQRGRGDLVQIGYRAAMNLTAQIAGIDIDPHDETRTDELYEIVKKFSEGATLMHSTRNKDQVRAEVREAADHFHTSFYLDSLARRVAMVEENPDGLFDEARFPHDVLTTLLRNHDRLPLTHETMFREICFYLQAGAHSTANAFTHTVDDIVRWTSGNEADVAQLDQAFVQRCMHESLRLSPASPVAYRTPVVDVVLADGTALPLGSTVILDLTAANSDVDVFGDSGPRFDPNRMVPKGVPRWGLSFGSGMHACVGAELDGGREIVDDRPADEHLYGTVAIIAHAFFAAGGRQDPTKPPVVDPNSTRTHYSRYPVVFYDPDQE